jgi:hypothetical protein
MKLVRGLFIALLSVAVIGGVFASGQGEAGKT